jgi:hypothetical protein
MLWIWRLSIILTLRWWTMARSWGHVYTEDYKEWALAVSRLNEFVRSVRARLNGYGWEVFEKESYADGNRVYMEVRWVKKVRIPGKEFVSVMDIYELARPYLKTNTESSESAVQPL